MDTKEAILSAALKLYNSKGISAVTSRHIAASLDISPGNLHYHYKHTDDIIAALCSRLVVNFDELMVRMEEVDDIVVLFEDSFELVYKYRFIFLHFVEIGMRLPAFRKTYQELMVRREKEFKILFNKLVERGVFRKDIPDEIWSALVTQIFVLGDFWLSNNELTNRLKGAAAKARYVALFQGLFYPYRILG